MNGSEEEARVDEHVGERNTVRRTPCRNGGCSDLLGLKLGFVKRLLF